MNANDASAVPPSQRDALRQDLRSWRRAVPPAERIAAAQALAAQLFTLPFAPSQGFVAGYWASDGEIALPAWQLGLPPDCRYCLPVLGADRQLRFAPWRAGEALVANRFGIPEPAVDPSLLLAPRDMAMIVLPLVGFDGRGQRLGMGGGWYDRSLQLRLHGHAPPFLVGAAFDGQRIQQPLTAAAWDVPLDAVCTPTQTLLFTHEEASPA